MNIISVVIEVAVVVIVDTGVVSVLVDVVVISDVVVADVLVDVDVVVVDVFIEGVVVLLVTDRNEQKLVCPQAKFKSFYTFILKNKLYQYF